MPSLDDFGKTAAATIAFYVPILCISAVLVMRHGFKRDAGWIFLLFFSIARIVGGALLVAAQLVRPVNTGLYTGAYILEAAGLSPLLLATLGFLRTIGQNSFGERGRMALVFRFLGMIALVGLVLSIVGGTESNTTLRRVGVILYLVLYILLVAIHVKCWLNASTLMKHRKTLLIGISAALPFLLVRVIYSVLATFSGSMVVSSTSLPSTNSLAKFNVVSGDWRVFLVMSLIMEYIVVVIYTVAGTKIPLQDDYHTKGSVSPSEGYPMHPGQFQQGQTAYPPQAHSGYAA